MLEDEKYAGNCKVGDKVSLASKDNTPGSYTQEYWNIIEVGVANEHGSRRDIQIQIVGGSRTAVVSTDDYGWRDDGFRVIVIPPDNEIPEEMKKWVALHDDPETSQPTLFVARACRNRNEGVYRIVCAECLIELYLVSNESSGSDFMFRNEPQDQHWSNSKWEMHECNVTVECACKEREVPLERPENYEVQW